MADQHLYRVQEVTTRLGISDQTLRQYCNRYGQFLSGHAAPVAGQTRHFTDTDVRVLTLIRNASGARNVDVLQTVTAAVASGNLPEMPDAPASKGAGAVALQQARDTWLIERAGLQREVEIVQGQVDKLEAQLAAERSARIEDLRALADLRAELARAQTLVDLYQAGRLQGGG